MNDDSVDWALLARHLSGVTSVEEERTLQRWLEADPSRARLLDSLRQAWEASGRLPRHRDVDAAWARVRARTQPGGERSRPSRPVPAESGAPPVRSVTSAVRRRRRFVPSARLLRVAALFIVAVLPPLLLGPLSGGFRDAPEHVLLRDVAAARGERVDLDLSDGSRVILAPGSRLRYPEPFEARGRELQLEGSAYFEVASDPRRPFLVRANGTLTRVLGTRFVVHAYPEEPPRVAVAEGRVALRADGAPVSEGVVLAHGQLGQVAEDGSAAVVPGALLDRYLGWTEGRMVVRNTALAEAARDLERWYDVDIEIPDPVLASRLITTSFGEEPIGQILDLITTSLDAHYQRAGERITLVPAPR